MKNYVLLSLLSMVALLTATACDSNSIDSGVQSDQFQPLPDRRILSLEDSTLRVDVTVNSGAATTFFIPPGEPPRVTVSGIIRGQNNVVELKWYEIHNGFVIELSTQTQNISPAGSIVAIDVPHSASAFDYDGDGTSNLDERANDFCVWSADEACLTEGVLDVPPDTQAQGTPEVGTPEVTPEIGIPVAGTTEPSTLSPPADAASLQNALQTRYVSESDFDVWRCSFFGSGDPQVAFSMPSAGTLGTGLIAREYALSTGGESDFTWQATSGTSIRTTSLDTGRSINNTNYQFQSDTSYTFEILDFGVACDLVDIAVALGG